MHFVDNVDNVDYYINISIFLKKISTKIYVYFSYIFVDNVDNYSLRRFSPTFTMSPAPIVINMSFGVQVFLINFSISSKVEM